MGLSLSINKNFGSFRLDLTWHAENELTALFGYSGAGKTMTLQMIAGLIEPDRGRIEIDSTILYSSEKSINLSPQKRGIGYVFQDLALFPHMTVLQNILYGGHEMPRKEREAVAQDMLHRFRISELSDQMPHQISGGQKQRVAIARALMRRPRIILLDEPFSALDMPVRLEMRKMLKMVQQSFRIPVVLITHDADEVRAIADRMIVYSAGRVLQSGPPEEVFLAPACLEVESLICLRERPGTTVPSLLGSPC